MLYSEGVSKGRLTLEQFVQVTSTNAAKLLNIYPRKGVIAEGSDADVTIWNPNASEVISAKRDYYSRSDFSLYEGWAVKGLPELVLRAGEVACVAGKVAAKGSGQGKVLRRPPHSA
jgi:dihydropyrimidinase